MCAQKPGFDGFSFGRQDYAETGLLVLSVQCAAIIARASNLEKTFSLDLVCSCLSMCPSVTFVCKFNALMSYELMKSYDIRSYEQKN